MPNNISALVLIMAVLLPSTLSFADPMPSVFEAGHPTLQHWTLGPVPHPADNQPTPERVNLGKMLFFDPRLSGDGNMSCATCHNPALGWSDGLPTARGVNSMILDRASPTIVNSAYNTLQMWDGRKRSLEHQATGPMEADVEMNMPISDLVSWLNSNSGYVRAFRAAYPDEGVTSATLAKAIASFERTVISRNSPFDRWVAGDAEAMSIAQVRGFEVFTNPEQGNCAVCHSAPNFTDDGFHNLGLPSNQGPTADLGRFHIKPIGLMRGAFKTPTLRDIATSAPYFHDGSASTLREVVEHYVTGGAGDVVSPNMKPLDLSDPQIDDLITFMEALTSPPMQITLPALPRSDGPVFLVDWQDDQADEPQLAANTTDP